MSSSVSTSTSTSNSDASSSSSSATKSFKAQHSYDDRVEEARRIIMKYPDRLPVIVEKHTSGNTDSLPNLQKTKFLVPDHITYGQFVYIIRTRIHLQPEKALFLFVNNKLPSASSGMRSIYEQNKDEDNFLYCFYSSESTFG